MVAACLVQSFCGQHLVLVYVGGGTVPIHRRAHPALSSPLSALNNGLITMERLAICSPASPHTRSAGHREQSPPAQASLLCPLRPLAPVPSGRMLAHLPATTGLFCQLFGSICSHANCAQRRGDRLQAPRMWVSEIHGPLTVPPWATPAAEGQGGVRLSLSLFALSSVPLVSPWLRYVTGIQVFARKGGGDSVGRKKKTSPITEKPGHGGTTSPPAHLAGVGSKHELPAPANGVCSETPVPTPAEEGGAGDQHWTERKPFSAY